MQPASEPRKSYMKNVIVLSICFFGIFFAFNTSQVGVYASSYPKALQTNSHGIQGYINLGCLYGMFAAFSIIGPKIVAMVGPKSEHYFALTE